MFPRIIEQHIWFLHSKLGLFAVIRILTDVCRNSMLKYFQHIFLLSVPSNHRPLKETVMAESEKPSESSEEVSYVNNCKSFWP